MKSFVADPGVVVTSIMTEQFSWIMVVFMITPLLYLARMVLDSIVYTPWNASISLFYLSGFSETGGIQLKSSQNESMKCEADLRFAARESWYDGRLYVETVSLLNCSPDQKEEIRMKGKKIMEEMEKLRVDHFSNRLL